MTDRTDRRRSRAARPGLSVRLLLLGCLGIAIFIGLGIWQVERRSWKLALIARVDARVQAAPVPAPGPAEWPGITRADAEYRHVTVSGRFEPERETLVKAVTDLGPGFWVLTPLATDDGWTVLVNRGFVPPERAGAGQHPTPADRVTVTGLLRITEPRGGFLRSNDPASDRWYSRDVQAISQARDLMDVAPYFIDAGPNGQGWPRGGLTVISFYNNHLVYALTWFGMALALAFALVAAGRDLRRNPRDDGREDPPR